MRIKNIKEVIEKQEREINKLAEIGEQLYSEENKIRNMRERLEAEKELKRLQNIQRGLIPNK